MPGSTDDSPATHGGLVVNEFSSNGERDA